MPAETNSATAIQTVLPDSMTGEETEARPNTKQPMNAVSVLAAAPHAKTLTRRCA